MQTSQMLMSRAPLRPKARRFVNSLTLQLLGVMGSSIVAPLAVSFLILQRRDIDSTGTMISIGASLASALLALFVVRRVTSFPGTRHFAYIIPGFCVTFGSTIGLLLALRLEYSSVLLFSAFVATTLFTFMVMLMGNKAGLSFYVVPYGSALNLQESREVAWIVLKTADLPHNDKFTPIVADLRYDFDPQWERMLAAAAISGRPVYHSKQVRESLTGKVELEHLSENSFGSLLPNTAYRKIKRTADIMVALISLPVLLLPLLLIGLAIRFESPGHSLFRQERMGYRGRTFRVLKFRTMRQRPPAECEEERREQAITKSDDERITPLGRFLRRTRIDELPQLWNVLLGEMSLIGPRPEAVALSQWYERELPFYSYRHIVRPGITGWAQVSQGHVSDLDSVHTKLHYDFYYIKNFSAWLDLLIVMRTIQTILTGFGSK